MAPQLRMIRNIPLNADIPMVNLKDGYSFRCFNESIEDRDYWLDIVMHGLTDGRKDYDTVKSTLYDMEGYEPAKTFFITAPNGIPCATVTVICNYETVHGYIHMVACKPEHRGKGLGTQLNNIANKTLIESGMRSAHLTTDDFRIPAIRSYINAGFEPDPNQLAQPDLKKRWDDVYKCIAENKRV